MRTLYLLRHAKSSWKDTTLRDFDRPLKSRGREAAESVGGLLASEKLSVLMVISSPALRARETTRIVMKSAGLQAEPRFDERVYDAGLSALLEVLSGIPDDQERAIMVGHNPGLEELLAFLTGSSRQMPTCALARIEIAAPNWRVFQEGEGRLEWLVTPKELPGD